MPPAATLRAMTMADIDSGLRLCRLSHWNQVARDWEQFLRLTPGGATVAVDETGLVIGTVATMRYAAAQHGSAVQTAPSPRHPVRGDLEPSTQRPGAGSSLAPGTRYPAPVSVVPGTPHPVPASLGWIAMVLVDPARRGDGIGTALLQQGLTHIADVPTAGLDATPLGQPLYEKLGFQADSRFTRMRRAPTVSSPSEQRHDPSARVRMATPADRDAIAALDAQVTGLDRHAMLEWLQTTAPECAWVREGSRGIEGALLGRRGYAALHLGPLLATSTAKAVGLVGEALAASPGQPVIVDIADDCPGWRHAMDTFGFRAERPFTRMYRGPWRPDGDATRLYAIIGPEFG